VETTWSYSAGVWTDLTATAGTAPAFFGGMAYDAHDHYVVYFGGYTLSDQLTDATFTFSNGTWTNLSATVHGAPSARINYGITYDDALQQVILYGGLDQVDVFNASAYSTQTWAYSSGNWTLLAGNGTSYNTQSMVYDPSTNQTILLGSSNFSVVPPNVVTWIWAPGYWTIGAPTIVLSAQVADAGQSFTIDVTQSPNAGALSSRSPRGMLLGRRSSTDLRGLCDRERRDQRSDQRRGRILRDGPHDDRGQCAPRGPRLRGHELAR
jgi:hypothetical protein